MVSNTDGLLMHWLPILFMQKASCISLAHCSLYFPRMMILLKSGMHWHLWQWIAKWRGRAGFGAFLCSLALSLLHLPFWPIYTRSHVSRAWYTTPITQGTKGFLFSADKKILLKGSSSFCIGVPVSGGKTLVTWHHGIPLLFSDCATRNANTGQISIASSF